MMKRVESLVQTSCVHWKRERWRQFMLYDNFPMFDYCKDFVIYIASASSLSSHPPRVRIISFSVFHDSKSDHPMLNARGKIQKLATHSVKATARPLATHEKQVEPNSRIGSMANRREMQHDFIDRIRLLAL